MSFFFDILLLSTAKISAAFDSFFIGFRRLIFYANNSAENLHQLQAGLNTASQVNDASLKYFVLLGAIIVLSGLMALIIHFRRKKNRQTKGWSSITNSQSIWEVLSRALARQAHFTLDLYEANRTVSYKGVLSGLEDNSFLVLTLADPPPSDADFTDLPGVLHINFKAGPKEPIEHYQFATKILSLRFVKVNNWREAMLVLPLPKVITSAQRRSFLRLEPIGEHAFSCGLYTVPEGPIPDLSALEEVCQGDVLDISIGGAQLKLPSNVTLKETQRFLGLITLPTNELNLELTDRTLVLLLQLLSQEFVQMASDRGQISHNILRVRFLGRYMKDKVNNVWNYRGLTQMSLEDLSYWMQAYQRLMLKKKNNLLPPPSGSHRPPNMFPPSPPKRPPLKED
ncbi:MAG: hypothetical protein LBV23_11485 [Deltaproteobacteria bacterium]|jgi:hypothetical protein|nr:hypothetical protein [Deltaproteobacteria bacterium]